MTNVLMNGEINKYSFPLVHLESAATSPATTNVSASSTSIPTHIVDSQRKLRQWLEQVEQSLLNDKVRIVDLQAIDAKKKIYKDLLDQTLEQEHLMEQVSITAREFYSRTTIDNSRRVQEELTNYQDRLYDVKMFLSERLAKYNRLDKTLSEFEVRSTTRRTIEKIRCSSREVLKK